MDLVFTEPGLEKSPKKNLSPFTSKPRFTLKYNEKTLPEHISKELHSIYQKMTAIIGARYILLKPYFQDYDPLRKGRITKTQFASVLDKLNIGLEHNEIKVLAERYLDERGDVDYVSLCNHLDGMSPLEESINPHIK